MAQLELIVIGASAGSLAPLTEIVMNLPVSLPAAIVIVVHTRNDHDGLLASILGRAGSLPAKFPEQGEPIEQGTIYVAPPDKHLLIGPRGLILNSGPRENGFRPAIDPLFRTASRVFTNRVMGVILSGALDDGTYGLKILKEAGGTAVVQDPEEAQFPSMPLSAIRNVAVDHVLRAADIASLITTLAGETVEGERAMAKSEDPEPQSLAEETNVEEMMEDFGPPSGLTCPDCGGALWEIKNDKLLRYRCHVGHQFLQDSLDAQQQEAVEGALWTAVRALEEHSDLRERMAKRAEAGGMESVATAFATSARDSHKQAHSIRELLFGRSPHAITPLSGARSNGKSPARRGHARKAKVTKARKRRAR